jgi:hypothetical protein
MKTESSLPGSPGTWTVESSTHSHILRFDIILQLMPIYFNWFLPFWFSDQTLNKFFSGRRVRLTTLPPSMSRCLKMWEPQPLATLRASKACTGITLPLPLRTTCPVHLILINSVTLVAFGKECIKKLLAIQSSLTSYYFLSQSAFRRTGSCSSSNIQSPRNKVWFIRIPCQNSDTAS